MTAQKDYWQECISIAAEECELKLTPSQLECLASAAESGHENYGMAFYSPSSSERMSDIEDEWKNKLKALQAEFDAYRNSSESAVKKALRLRQDDNISIDQRGGVWISDGRTEQIQW